MNSNPRWRAALVVFFAAAFIASASKVSFGASEFRPIYPETVFGSASSLEWSLTISEISGDGTAVAGTARLLNVIFDCATFTCGTTAFAWSLEEESRIDLGHVPLSPTGYPKAGPYAVAELSYDGRSALVTAEYRHYESAIIREGTAHLFREEVIRGDYLLAVDMSSDASVVVGAYDNEPFLWKEEAGLLSLAGLGPDPGYSPVTISGDGKAVILRDGAPVTLGADIVIADPNAEPPPPPRNPIRWTEGRGVEEMTTLVDARSSNIRKTSFDGSVTIGTSYFDFGGPYAATVWRETTPHKLQIPEGYWSTYANDLTANGTTFVGGATVLVDEEPVVSTDQVSLLLPGVLRQYYESQAVIWRDGEPDILRDVLEHEYNLGSQIEGWLLTSATAISDDGTVIAGRGIDPEGNSASWVAVLVVPEPPTVVFLLLASLLSRRRRLA